jgi:hypothetical protein
MIDSKDLRIGNFVNYNGILSKVAAIHNDHSIGILFVDDPRNDGVSHIELNSKSPVQITNPIELTEEWLLKFGFKGTNLPLYLSTGFIDFVWKNQMFLDIEGQWLSVKCDYVHTLQNLYWCLCGEELTIK